MCVCVNVINKSKLESSINNTEAGNEGTGSNRKHRNTQIALMTTGHKLSFSIGSVRNSALAQLQHTKEEKEATSSFLFIIARLCRKDSKS